MKYSLSRRVRGYIVTILLLCVFQLVLLQVTRLDVSGQTDAKLLQQQIVERQRQVQNISLIFFVFLFIVGVVFFFSVPGTQYRSLSDLRHLLHEISRGNYSLDVNLDVFEERNDPPVQELLETTGKMLSTMRHFDQIKKEKIVEHLGRIQAMLKLCENGYIIITLEGQIKFVSDNVTELFPVLTADQNVLESNYPPEVENSIIKYIHGILRDRAKAEAQQYFVPALKRHITLKSVLVRDTGGLPIGAVIGLYNIVEKKKSGKDAEEA